MVSIMAASLSACFMFGTFSFSRIGCRRVGVELFDGQNVAQLNCFVKQLFSRREAEACKTKVKLPKIYFAGGSDCGCPSWARTLAGMKRETRKRIILEPELEKLAGHLSAADRLLMAARLSRWVRQLQVSARAMLPRPARPGRRLPRLECQHVREN